MHHPQSQTHPPTEDPVEQFSAELAKLRLRAGEPSFRSMAKKSGCISHTTLHDAAKGVRFPSWETTEQFVRICGGDVNEWRERWIEAQQATRRPQSPEDAGVGSFPDGSAPDTRTPAAGSGSTPVPDDAAANSAPTASPAPAVPRESADSARRNRWLALWPVALVAVIALAVGFVVGRVSAPVQGDTVSEQVGEGSQADGAGEVPPSEPGDAAAFLTDVTLSDGTVVGTGETHTKIWRFRNVGTVPWEDRYLIREDVSANVPCDTADRVEVPATAPGETVDVRVEVRTPDSPVRCKVLWFMGDEAEEASFPGGRPVFFDIVVE
ncbi:hypothetical protein GCM10027403_13560 [Arthrobacter tecti]